MGVCRCVGVGSCVGACVWVREYVTVLARACVSVCGCAWVRVWVRMLARVWAYYV